MGKASGSRFELLGMSSGALLQPGNLRVPIVRVRVRREQRTGHSRLLGDLGHDRVLGLSTLGSGLTVAENLKPKDGRFSFLSTEVAMVKVCIFEVVGEMLITLGGSHASWSLQSTTDLDWSCLKTIARELGLCLGLGW